MGEMAKGVDKIFWNCRNGQPLRLEADEHFQPKSVSIRSVCFSMGMDARPFSPCLDPPNARMKVESGELTMECRRRWLAISPSGT
jgi:hypothetical protein